MRTILRRHQVLRCDGYWVNISKGKTKSKPSIPSPIPSTSPVPSSVVGLAAQQPDGGGVRDDEPFDDLMRVYTQRLMTFRVRERLRRYVAGVFQTVLRKRKPRK